MFTGDGVGASGDFLMAALKRAGFANISTSQRIDDGLTLTDVYIAAAVRCAPPANKPLPEEVERCLPHLANEIAHLPRLQVVVALGKIAWDAWLKLLMTSGDELPRPRPAFAHGAKWTRWPHAVGVYHPSRQNTNTASTALYALRSAASRSMRTLGSMSVNSPTHVHDAELIFKMNRETESLTLMNERNARTRIALAARSSFTSSRSGRTTSPRHF